MHVPSPDTPPLSLFALLCDLHRDVQVLQVQPPTKKVMAARDWRNGIRKKRLDLAALETVAA